MPPEDGGSSSFFESSTVFISERILCASSKRSSSSTHSSGVAKSSGPVMPKPAVMHENSFLMVQLIPDDSNSILSTSHRTTLGSVISLFIYFSCLNVCTQSFFNPGSYYNLQCVDSSLLDKFPLDLFQNPSVACLFKIGAFWHWHALDRPVSRLLNEDGQSMIFGQYPSNPNLSALFSTRIVSIWP